MSPAIKRLKTAKPCILRYCLIIHIGKVKLLRRDVKIVVRDLYKLLNLPKPEKQKGPVVYSMLWAILPLGVVIHVTSHTRNSSKYRNKTGLSVYVFCTV